MKMSFISVSVGLQYSLIFVFSLAATPAKAAVVRQAALRVKTSAERISPALEPKSPKKFDKDYPVDDRSVTDKYYVFDHPYPAVQDSGDFDRDYVQDENSDGGRWAAQMEYDTLRAKIQKDKEKLEKLKDKMEKEYEDWMRAKKDAENYEDALARARKEMESARSAAEAAAKRVNDLEGHSQPDGTKAGGAIGRAIGDVKKEMDDLEKCKEALRQAKQRLKDLLKKQAEYEEAKAKEAKEKETKDKEAKEKEVKKAAEAEKKKTEKQKEKNNVKEATTDEDKDEKKTEEDKSETKQDAKKEVERDTKKASSWRKNYLKELDDVRQTERELEAAAKVLKKFRRPPYVDDNGGIYNVPDSARMHTPATFIMMAFAVVVACCL